MLPEHRLPPGWPLQPDQPFTLQQARAAGVDRLLSELLRSRVVRRPLRGVYVSAAVPDGIVLRATCVSLVMPAGCFVTDRCAGWLRGADMTLAPNEDVLVPRVSFFRPSDEGRLRNDLCASGERRVRRDELVEVHGILATDQLRTAFDLGRLQRPDVALAGMDSMARLGGFEVADLVAGASVPSRTRTCDSARAISKLGTPSPPGAAASPTDVRQLEPTRRWSSADSAVK